ncbi:DUF5666 domain-containing protein [Granulicella sp. WH15]|uniref:DUF5666 domain-containing protein n=1 Tax=Granulicella sp. WH15 TaxID=2602070 RepID=UPI0021055FA7|nr:DUF5666 domain-containing protein [Granulicella sp. WH15]
MAAFAIVVSCVSVVPYGLAQAPAAPAAAAASARQLGTVTAIAGSVLTLSTDTGKTMTVTVADGAKVLQLAPGSTDLKTATPVVLTDIAVGDRVLAAGKPGDTSDTLTATRVVLMKSTAIAEKHASEQDEWKRQGMSGIVSAIAPDSGGAAITVTAGPRKVIVQATSTTTFRRYAGDSVKFNDARPSTLDQIHVGDQLSVRGPKSEDGTSLSAIEIVSGSFRNLSGIITAIDAGSGSITLKDLATKQTVKVSVTTNSDLRALPAEVAARFAARAKGETPAAAAPASASGSDAPGPRRSAGGDLSQMLARLPAQTLAGLKSGDAVMIVASASQTGTFTAVTLLSGVEPILSATPSGAAPMTLSPWSVGGGSPEGGGL